MIFYFSMTFVSFVMFVYGGIKAFIQTLEDEKIRNDLRGAGVFAWIIIILLGVVLAIGMAIAWPITMTIYICLEILKYQQRKRKSALKADPKGEREK